MTSAGWALQASLHQSLVNSPRVLSLLGGARIYEKPPRGSDYPYVAIGPSTERDWSTGSGAGTEHIVTLDVWSRSGSRREAQEIMAAIRTVLHDAELSLAEHRLINLRHEQSMVRRDDDGETFHGSVRYRAVTEPAP